MRCYCFMRLFCIRKGRQRWQNLDLRSISGTDMWNLGDERVSASYEIKTGVKTAESAKVMGGSVSAVKNIVAVIKGEEDPEDPVKAIERDTASSAIMGYEKQDA